MNSAIKILLVEDNPGDVRLVEEMLAEASRSEPGLFNFKLKHTSMLSTGLDILRDGDIDTILLDLGLPDSQGLDTIIEFKTKAPGVPIIAFTGLDDQNLALTVLQNGAQDYLVKGQVNSALLARTMRYAIERERMTRDLKMSRRREQHLAYHDILTNLPNRTLFYDRLKQAIATAKRNLGMVAVIFLDLDGFKKINDTLGHSKGDLLLQFVAQKLKSNIRDCDSISRLGGDEFTIILSDIDGPHDCAHAAEKILRVFSEPFYLVGDEVHISASIGISLYPVDADEIESLVKNADLAMYHAKKHGKNNYRMYDLSMNAETTQRLEMENLLRKASARDELVVHYQPRVNIETGRISGVEALMRWKHPEKGLMYPNDFIPLAEETGTIILMGEWILRAACRQNVQWRKNGLSPCRVAVNLSPRQFGEEKLANTVRHILDDTGMDPEYLELEITEGSAMQDLDYTVATLQSLKKMGIGIAIDDFGGGYSSLNYLKRFPLDLLKIDQSFIHDVPKDRVNAAIINAMVALGRGLGLTTIAEGVENESQLEFLRSVQCDEIQGFYFSRPLPVEGIEKLLQSNNRKFW